MSNAFTPEQIAQILEEFFKTVGTRQYIGARYVPIFGRKDETSIEWDNSAPYEPLTIVLYQGNSYTSRQYVPAGVDIDNQDFWALTGNYNAQVEQYRRDTAHALEVAEGAQEIANNAQESANNAQADIDTLLPKNAFEAISVKDYIDESAENLKEIIDNEHMLNDTLSTAILGTDIVEARYIQNASVSGQLSCATKHGDKIYAIYPYNNNAGDCALRIYDLTHNTITNVTDNSDSENPNKPYQNGHANSIAYVEDKDLIISPWLITYTTNSHSASNLLNVYYPNFVLKETISTARYYNAVSYDSVTGNLYAAQHVANSTIVNIYQLNKDTFAELNGGSPVQTYDNPDLNEIQDVAVHNGYVYINTPTFTLNVYSIESSELIKTYKVSASDFTDTYNLGEFEGIEFDEDGTLIAAFSYSIRDNPVIGFIGTLNNIPTNKIYNLPAKGTLTLSDDYNNVFFKPVNQIRSIAEINCIKDDSIRTVNGRGTDLYAYNYYLIYKPIFLNVVRQNDPLQIRPIRTVKYFSLYVGSNGIMDFVEGTSGSSGTVFTTKPFDFSSYKVAAGLSCNGTITINGNPIPVPSSTIENTGNPNLVSIAKNTNSVFQINNEVAPEQSIYIGNARFGA